MAANGHLTAHFAQPVQPGSSCSVAVFCQFATASDSTRGGHTATHQPQPVQRAGSITGRALRSGGMGQIVGRCSVSWEPPWSEPHMPETTFHIPTLLTQEDADAVMFELQDLPCVNQADVDLPAHSAWVSHTAMISADDIAAKLAEAGYEATPR